MINNSRNVPGRLNTHIEYAYNATNIARESLFYVEYVGHTYCNDHFYVLRQHYCHYLLMYVIDGGMALSSAGNEYVVEPGQAFLIETQKPHIYGALDKLEALWIHFNGENFHPLFEYLLHMNNGSHVFDLRKQPEFYIKLKNLVESFGSSNPKPEIVISANMYELFALLVANPSKKDNSLDSIIGYINQHYSENLSLEFLANKVGFSIARFSSLFKDKTGYSPHQYIVNTRLHASRQYLSVSTYSVEAISELVGFSHTSSFIYAFRKKYKTTPYQFRKSIHVNSKHEKET